MKWKVTHSSLPQNIPELEQVLVSNRNLQEPDKFFAPPDPFSLSLEELGIDPQHMKRTIERLELARERKEDVLIFGDYDADGICSTAIMWEALREFGIVARPFIPHREKHGYGLSERSLTAVLAEKKPDLLISVDNGIVAHAAFQQLKDLGIDAILTDHHQPEKTLPPAFAIIHSTQLCGATVAWCVARELSPVAAKRSLDLAAIATITDQMSMLGVCRSFVVHGLPVLQKTQRVGLQVLYAKAGVAADEVSVNTINFAIGPRINAMGRIKHGMDALRLLCTKNIERADQLVAELNITNTSRQDLTAEMVQHALESAHLWENEHLIIVHSSTYHEGVIGLIAGKLAEQFYKPAIVLAVGEKVAKASARSIAGVNIIDLIRLVKDDLLEAGGHPMAAGFGVLPEKLPIVQERLLVLAREKITPEMLDPAVAVECIVPPSLLTLQTYEELQKFAPFGQQNPEPVLGVLDMVIVGSQTIGRDAKHLKLGVIPASDKTGATSFTCIGWNMGDLAADLLPGSSVNIAVTLEVNEWKSRRSLQLMLKDIAVPAHHQQVVGAP